VKNLNSPPDLLAPGRCFFAWFQPLMLALILLGGLTIGGAYIAQADTLDGARQQMNEGRDVQASALLETWIREHTTDYEAVFLLGMAYTQQEKYAKAIEMFHQVSALRPELAEPHGNLAVIYNELGKPQAAARELELFLERKPGDAVTHENLGDIHIKLALRNYRAALVRDKNPSLLKKYQQLLQYEHLQSTDASHAAPEKGQTSSPERPYRTPLAGRISLAAPVPIGPITPETDIAMTSTKISESERSALPPPYAFLEAGHAEQDASIVKPQKFDVAEVQNTHTYSGIVENNIRHEKKKQARHAVDKSVVHAVERWRLAWAAKDLSGYFNAYANDFTPFKPGVKGKNIWPLETWKKYKTRVISKKAYIHVTLNNMRIEILDHGSRAVVRFLQFFDSNNYSSQDEKEITLKNEPDGWKIVQESVL